jgi:hypothetical protein
MKNIYTLRERATNKLYRKVMREMLKAPTDLKAGDKVRFSDDWVNNSPFYKTMNSDRRTFVEAHRNDVFTLAYDKNHDNSSTVFVFEEDDSEVKWLWAASELKRTEEQ